MTVLWSLTSFTHFVIKSFINAAERMLHLWPLKTLVCFRCSVDAVQTNRRLTLSQGISFCNKFYTHCFSPLRIQLCALYIGRIQIMVRYSDFFLQNLVVFHSTEMYNKQPGMLSRNYSSSETSLIQKKMSLSCIQS